MGLTPFKVTYDQSCELPETTQPDELIDGELRMPAAPNRRHQEILGRLYLAIAPHVKSHSMGHVVYSPIDVVLDRARPLVLEPDLLFVSHSRAHILGVRIFGAPDLVIEILSPAGGPFDRTEKAAHYAQYEVREYWLVDAEAETVEVRELEPRGYESVGVFGRGAGVRSVILPDLSFPGDGIFMPEAIEFCKTNGKPADRLPPHPPLSRIGGEEKGEGENTGGVVP